MMTGFSNFHMGTPIVASAWIPEFIAVLKISQAVTMSNEAKAEMNAWLLDMFGVKRQFLYFSNKIVCHPNNVKFLEQRIGQ